MIRSVLLSSAMLVSLSGCARISDSRLNPLNWFASSQAEAASVDGTRRPLTPEGRRAMVVDNRVLVQSVSALEIDRTASGAIVRATGITQTQGFYNAELVDAGLADGVLTLEFRAQAPAGSSPDGPLRTGEIETAYVIDPANLSVIRSVRVQSATNVRTATR